MTPEITAMLVRDAQAFESNNNAVYPNGNFLQTAAENMRAFTHFYRGRWELWGSPGFWVQMAFTMLLGLLAGRLRWAQRIPELALTIFFAIQGPWSNWWLIRNDRGPMEQLWAWMTYGSRGVQVDARAA
jgi:hypothetical protein